MAQEFDSAPTEPREGPSPSWGGLAVGGELLSDGWAAFLEQEAAPEAPPEEPSDPGPLVAAVLADVQRLHDELLPALQAAVAESQSTEARQLGANVRELTTGLDHRLTLARFAVAAALGAESAGAAGTAPGVDGHATTLASLDEQISRRRPDVHQAIAAAPVPRPSDMSTVHAAESVEAENDDGEIAAPARGNASPARGSAAPSLDRPVAYEEMRATLDPSEAAAAARHAGHAVTPSTAHEAARARGPALTLDRAASYQETRATLAPSEATALAGHAGHAVTPSTAHPAALARGPAPTLDRAASYEETRATLDPSEAAAAARHVRRSIPAVATSATARAAATFPAPSLDRVASYEETRATLDPGEAARARRAQPWSTTLDRSPGYEETRATLDVGARSRPPDVLGDVTADNVAGRAGPRGGSRPWPATLDRAAEYTETRATLDATARPHDGAGVPERLRPHLERAAGASLGHVRVHAGAAAAAVASQHDARAVTIGDDIYFDDGELDDESEDGQLLLAHEVAHTVQQRGAPAPATKGRSSSAVDASRPEREADRFAEAVIKGGPVPALHARDAAIPARKARDADDDLAGPADLWADPQELTFDPTPIGQESSAQAVSISNLGTDPVTIEDIVDAAGSAASAFPTYGGASGGALASGDALSVQFAFRPTTAGPHDTVARVMTRGGAVSATIRLHGTGTASSERPLLTPSSKRVQLPDTQVGEESPATSIELTNEGAQPVAVEEFVVTPHASTNDGEFVVSGRSEPALAPGASTSVSAVFVPTAARLRSATLAVKANHGATATKVRLAGRGRPFQEKSEEDTARERGDDKYHDTLAKDHVQPATSYGDMLAALFAAQRFTDAGDPPSYRHAEQLVGTVADRMNAIAPKIGPLLKQYGLANLTGTTLFGNAHSAVAEWQRKLHMGSSINATYLVDSFRIAEEEIKLGTGEIKEASELRGFQRAGNRTAAAVFIAGGAVALVAAAPVIMSEAALAWESAKWAGTEISVWALANPDSAVVLAEMLGGLGIQLGEGGWEGFEAQFQDGESFALWVMQVVMDAMQLAQAGQTPRRGGNVDEGDEAGAPRPRQPAGENEEPTPRPRGPSEDADDPARPRTPGDAEAQQVEGQVQNEAQLRQSVRQRLRQVIDVLTKAVKSGGKVAPREGGATEQPAEPAPPPSRATKRRNREEATTVRGHVDAELEQQGMSKTPYRVEVLDDRAFEKKFSSKRGSAAMVIEDGVPTVYTRAKANPEDIAHEATHIAQLNDTSRPEVAANIRFLADENVGDWKHANAGLRKEMYTRKVAVEIDATERELAVAAGEGRTQLEQELDNLKALRDQVDALTDDQVAKINAGVADMPEYLEDPSFLFAKGRRQATDGVKQSPFRERDAGQYAEKVVKDSPLGKRGKVTQLGDEWQESVVVTTTSAGKVTVGEKIDGATVIYVDKEGTRRRYTVEDGAKILVKDGQEVAPGDTLAHEQTRRYRLVSVESGGSNELRTEVMNRKGRWQQSGEESRIRGEITEVAARRQVDAELAAEMDKPPDQRRDGLYKPVRIKHQSGDGKGFDDVIVEFSGTPESPSAKVRAVETKNYPNQAVPLKDITAVRENMQGNIQKLRDKVRAAREGGSSEEPFGSMSPRELDALDAALQANHVEVELRLGPTTRVSERTETQLREDLSAMNMRYSGATTVRQDDVDVATRAYQEGQEGAP